MDHSLWKVFREHLPKFGHVEMGQGATIPVHYRGGRGAPRQVERDADGEARNLELMQTLDDAWNAQDWDTFEKRHAVDTIVRWPAQAPTHGIGAHREEAVSMFKTFPDNRVENRPYKVLFGSGDWTCSVARFHGTMRDLLTLPDGRMMPPTGRRFEVDFCTVARWRDGQIVEENLFYDVLGMFEQLGIEL
jgi:predicted ester cyclase